MGAEPPLNWWNKKYVSKGLFIHPLGTSKKRFRSSPVPSCGRFYNSSREGNTFCSYVCLNSLKPAYNQLQILVRAVLTRVQSELNTSHTWNFSWIQAGFDKFKHSNLCTPQIHNTNGSRAGFYIRHWPLCTLALIVIFKRLHLKFVIVNVGGGESA